MLHRTSKLLSLLLAALLTATSLSGCTAATDSVTATGDTTTAAATTTTPPVTAAPSTCLSPAKLMRKIKEATELTYRYTMLYEFYGKEHEFTIITNLKNGKVMSTVINQDPYGNRSEVKSYYDLNNALHYEKDENNKMVATPTDVQWEGIVGGFGLSELLDANNMKKKGDHYEFPAAKAREWRDSHGFDGDVFIRLTEQDGVHIISLEFLNNSSGDDTIETYTIEFKSDSVRLPSVSP